jgi:hypothetical protein
MTILKSLTIVAVLLVGGTSLAMAQNGPATGNLPPVAGGAGGYPGHLHGHHHYGYGYRHLYAHRPYRHYRYSHY